MDRKFSFNRPPTNSHFGSYNQRNLSASSSSSFESSPPVTPTSPGKSDSMECRQCMRKGAPLFCFSCGFYMANGRVAQPCTRHPKVIFYTDFKKCPKCKGQDCLRELD